MIGVPRSTMSGNRAMAFGAALIAGAASIYMLRILQQGRPSESKKDGDTKESNGEGSFYERLGISDEDLPSHVRREIEEERAREELISLKTPMYDNVLMLNRERGPMCTISAKKAQWYVRKGLAEWSSLEDGDNGFENYPADLRCIRFLFEHNANGAQFGEGMSEHLYLRSAKQNICVACGDDGHHIRHYIVPYSYRALLPREYKTHMSHDIVILCPDCHLHCEGQTKTRMQRIEQDLRMKLGEAVFNASPVIDDPKKHHIRSCAIALAKWRENMPEEKVRGHERVVREYLASRCKKEEDRDAMLNGKEELTKSQLQKACSIKSRVKNPDFVAGSEVVVRSLTDARAIEEFIKSWRRHFVATVAPRHMPNGWSVDNPVISGKEARRSGKEGVKAW